MNATPVLGDEAIALGALHAGITAAYGYPGTPSTEILEYLTRESARTKAFVASWCTNEKTALEEALGTSFAGRRALVTMKHVGLNVASDALMNGALCEIKGGLVIAVADDPGMHSSQNEQDSRFYADFAKVPCYEPCTQQECYDMTREAFELSEQHHVPVLIRITTRIAHSRAGIITAEAKTQNSLEKGDRSGWMLLPAYARQRYLKLLETRQKLLALSETSVWNRVEKAPGPGSKKLGVITTGLGKNYFLENLADMAEKPAHMHISFYPLPLAKLRSFVASVDRVLVIEEGEPVVEQGLLGILPPGGTISGRLDGSMPRTGECNPDNVRKALGLPPRPVLEAAVPKLPNRPPQLCKGCPHADSYEFIRQATKGLESVAVTADIGCYALGALPPFAVPETIVCMGASVSMAKGAAEAGIKHAIAVIGDSTFLHSGITPLIDAASANVAMTVVILDNEVVAMTGCQETMLPSERLQTIVKGVGVDPEHVIVLEAHRRSAEHNIEVFRREFEYRGLSVIISTRECIEAARGRKKAE